SKVTLFADAEVVSFYKRQGWTLEPRGSKCAFWYAN
ncbi:GNAT family N-acetyltransferase, partial [Prochlorococcus sp. AH-736-K21]|nr:GNAT family N-acetyltransferase [Prochlorococcus sp. AH-736-K21]